MTDARRRFAWVASFVTVVTVLALGVGVRMPLQDVDTAGFMELVSGQRDDVLVRPLNSEYFSGVSYGLSLYGSDAVTACKNMSTANLHKSSVLPGHPYLVAIPLAIISFITGVSGRWIGAFAWATSVSFGLFALLHFLHRARVNIALQFSFLALMGLFPPLVLSLLGQAYFDKLLFGPAVFLLLQMYSFIKSSRLQLLPSVLSILAMALVSERGAMLAGFLSIVPCILHPRSARYLASRFAWVPFAGFLSLSWVFVWQRLIENTSLNDFSTSEIVPNLIQSLRNVHNEPYRSFFIVLLPLLFLSVFAGRWITFVLISIIPNLGIPLGILNILNFYVHYHQILIPALIAVSAIGLVNLSAYCQRIGRAIRAPNPVTTPSHVSALLLLVFSLLCWFRFGTEGLPSPTRSAIEVILPILSDDFQQKSTASTTILRFTDDLSRLVDTSATISAPGHFAPALQITGFKDFVSFPGALGQAEYVLLPSVGGATVVLPHADPQGIRQPLEECVTDVIVQKYSLVKEFGNYSGTNLYLFKAKNR